MPCTAHGSPMRDRSGSMGSHSSRTGRGVSRGSEERSRTRMLLVFAAGQSPTRPAATTTPATAATSDATNVVILRGEPVELAFANDLTGFASSLSASFANAVQMAGGRTPHHPRLPDPGQRGRYAMRRPRGRRRCHDHHSTPERSRAGHLCSFGFEGSPCLRGGRHRHDHRNATRDPCPRRPTVFNRTAVSDGDGFVAWYDAVSQSRATRLAARIRFGSARRPPTGRPYD